MEVLSLTALNRQVAEVVNETFDTPCWIVAELSEVRTAANGHCYVEFVEKDPRSGVVTARARGTIWAQRWNLLREAFEEAAGRRFTAGLKVQVEVQVQMHEIYGYSLTVLDIDPTFTLGEMARQRAEIIRRLTADGILEMNKELEMPLLPQRIAVISTATAAGYGDFIDQLSHNAAGCRFYPHLFAATMQGEKTESSIIAALDRIYAHLRLFDVVVIIRGGGATADLNCFDSYDLAANCAQFPLPIIVGIGHERDNTVLDTVAHTSVKTPTAAAALLIDCMEQQCQKVEALQQDIANRATWSIDRQYTRLNELRQALPRLLDAKMRTEQLQWQQRLLIVRQSHLKIGTQMNRLALLQQRIAAYKEQHMTQERQRLIWAERTIQMAQPDNLLKRGFSITRLNGHAVREAALLKPGDCIETQVADGTFRAIVKTP